VVYSVICFVTLPATLISIETKINVNLAAFSWNGFVYGDNVHAVTKSKYVGISSEHTGHGTFRLHTITNTRKITSKYKY
jgi:hypothetical protein